MASCSCGRPFNSIGALAGHQRATGHYGRLNAPAAPPTGPSTTGGAPSAVPPRSPGRSGPRAGPRGEGWLWKQVNRSELVREINSSSLIPTDAPVSSATTPELICSYNWQNVKTASIQVPGCAPKWQNVTLPVTLPADKGLQFIDQNASRIPQHPFEPIFQATRMMNPGYHFDDIDIIINRNSFRKLLDFCGGRKRDSFRVNLMLIQNTLFIERCERNVREFLHGTGGQGWGKNFEKTFTKFPPAAQNSSGHHRVLKYAFGNLTCAVRFEVDAWYDKDSAVGEGNEDIALSMENLTIGNTMGAGASTSTQNSQGQDATRAFSAMPQSCAAELKTAAKPKSLGQFLPQLWFGRTPWLIIGQHEQGTFKDIQITNAEEQFEAWETQQQDRLRKMVAVLVQLREAVGNHRDRSHVAVYERDSSPPKLRVYPMTERRRASIAMG